MNRLVFAFLVAGVDAETAGYFAVGGLALAHAHKFDGKAVPPGVVEAGRALEEYCRFVRANQCQSLDGSSRWSDTAMEGQGSWLTVAKASSISGVPLRTLYRHLRNGRLDHTTINRTKRVHIQDLIDYRRQGQCK